MLTNYENDNALLSTSSCWKWMLLIPVWKYDKLFNTRPKMYGNIRHSYNVQDYVFIHSLDF